MLIILKFDRRIKIIESELLETFLLIAIEINLNMICMICLEIVFNLMMRIIVTIQETSHKCNKIKIIIIVCFIISRFTQSKNNKQLKKMMIVNKINSSNNNSIWTITKNLVKSIWICKLQIYYSILLGASNSLINRRIIGDKTLQSKKEESTYNFKWKI